MWLADWSHIHSFRSPVKARSVFFPFVVHSLVEEGRESKAQVALIVNGEMHPRAPVCALNELYLVWLSAFTWVLYIKCRVSSWAGDVGLLYTSISDSLEINKDLLRATFLRVSLFHFPLQPVFFSVQAWYRTVYLDNYYLWRSSQFLGSVKYMILHFLSVPFLPCSLQFS